MECEVLDMFTLVLQPQVKGILVYHFICYETYFREHVVFLCFRIKLLLIFVSIIQLILDYKVSIASV